MKLELLFYHTSTYRYCMRTYRYCMREQVYRRLHMNMIWDYTEFVKQALQNTPYIAYYYYANNPLTPV